MKRYKDLKHFNIEEDSFILYRYKINQYTWYDKTTKDYICSVQTFDWWDGINLAGLEISKEYRGRGLSYAVIDYAVKILGARSLAVEHENLAAKHIYDKYGFGIIDLDEKYCYMRYKGESND